MRLRTDDLTKPVAQDLLHAAAGLSAQAADMTVFDAGQNSEASFARFAGTGLHYVESVPPATART